MIIPGHRIADLGLIEPCEPRTTHNGMSYGVSGAGYDIRVREMVDLSPDRPFALASSVERFRMTNQIVGIVHDKSTWARRGVAVQNTVLEPGWEGYLTLELTLHVKERIIIRPGDPIAQVVFHLLIEPVEPYSGKYQGQGAEPVPAILE